MSAIRDATIYLLSTEVLSNKCSLQIEKEGLEVVVTSILEGMTDKEMIDIQHATLNGALTDTSKEKGISETRKILVEKGILSREE